MVTKAQWGGPVSRAVLAKGVESMKASRTAYRSAIAMVRALAEVALVFLHAVTWLV